MAGYPGTGGVCAVVRGEGMRGRGGGRKGMRACVGTCPNAGLKPTKPPACTVVKVYARRHTTLLHHIPSCTQATLTFTAPPSWKLLSSDQ